MALAIINQKQGEDASQNVFSSNRGSYYNKMIAIKEGLTNVKQVGIQYIKS